MDDIGAGRMQLMEYILVERDQFDDLKMRGGATAEHLLRAIAEWDAAGHCINCKDAPLPAPEAFIVISSGSEIYAAGICARCADAENLPALAREHVRRAYPSMQIVKQGSA